MKTYTRTKPATFSNSFTTKPIRPVHASAGRKRKYPALFEQWQVDFVGKFTARTSSGTADLTLEPYKGALLMEIVSTYNQQAWLYGDDLDALITFLKQAKKAWLVSYRKAQREHAKNVRTRRAKKRRS